MGIRDHLRPGETLISDHKPFYATSYRIILCQEKDGREEVWELPYTRLTSVEMVKLPHFKLMIAGTLAVVGGAMMTKLGLFTSWLAIAAGVGMLLFGAIGREAYYQLRAHGMTKEEEARWRLDRWGSGSFVSTIRSIIGERPPL